MTTSPNDSRPILVTGAAGLIGRRLLDAFAPERPVIALDLNPPAESRPGVRSVRCDLTKDEDVARALAEVRAAAGDRLASVIHLAAYYDFAGEPSPLYEELTVKGTRRLLRGLAGFAVEQFVFSSTMLVHRPAAGDEVLDETSPLEAAWDYPASKIAAEKVIADERGSIPAVILRIAGVYNEDGHSVPLGQHIARIHRKDFESYLFPGDPKHGQPFVHLDDLVDAFRRVVERRRELGPHEVFVIAEPDVVSYRELQDAFGEAIHGRKWPTLRIPKEVAKAGAAIEDAAPGPDPFIKPWMIDFADAHYPFSVERAEKLLGWTARRRLRDLLPVMVARMQADPERWYRENGIEPPR